MRKLGAGVVSLLLGTLGLAQKSPNATGHWEGRIKIPNGEYSISVDLAKTAKGAWIGSITVLHSFAVDVPLRAISVDGPEVRFAADLPDKSAFEGRLVKDGKSILGKVTSATGQPEFQLTKYGQARVKLPPPSSPLPAKMEGTWEGTVGEEQWLVRLKLSHAADGTGTGVMVDVGHENKHLPLTTVMFKNNEFEFEVRSVSGSYRGTLGADGKIAGEYKPGNGQRMPLTFKHVAAGPKKS